ncbi:MAG: TorF family putative porin, partial [Colwellia sp.]|nr:TorF family putative porin [Colwellia sp.]
MSKERMNKNIIAVAASFLLTLSTTALADVSSTVNLASDYTFNGYSQTDSGPALQASLDYAADSGFYTGTWASNLDFSPADDTNLEWDFYAGQYFQVNDKVGLDTGIAYYTYHGADASDTYNYPEAYAKFGYSSSMGNSELNFWYSWDYFGVGTGHYIAMVAHTFEVASGHNIKVTFDRSTSTDKAKWAWDEAGNDAYNHYRVEYMTSWKGFDFDLALEDTSLDID